MTTTDTLPRLLSVVPAEDGATRETWSSPSGVYHAWTDAERKLLEGLFVPFMPMTGWGLP